MYIRNISIKNFKCYKDVIVNFDPHFNLIIGGNNAGKSTILEALRLWQLAFSRFLKDRTNQQSSSFYANQYFSFIIEDLSFLRISEFKSLFFNNDTTKHIEISVCFENNKTKVDLPIIFTLTTEERNLRFELCKTSKIRNQSSDRLLKIIDKPKGSSFKESILITYVNPIFLLPTKEEYKSKGLILEQLHQSRADEVIRNLINLYAPKDYQTKEKQIKKKELEKIENDLHYIIKGEVPIDNKVMYRFFSNFKPENDPYLRIIAKNINEKKVEVAQLGSGTINLLNILTVLSYGDYEKYNLNVLLLDEPDSHLHSNHQKRLFEHLIKVSKDDNKQMFVITHNHELINCSDNVLFIPSERNIKEINNITCEDYYIVYKEIAPEYHKKMLELATAKDLIMALNSKINEQNKPLVITEGKTDWKHFKHALKIFKQNDLYTDVDIDFWEYEDDIEMGASALIGMIKNLSNIKQQRPIIGIFDSDEKSACNFVNAYNAKNNVYAMFIEDPYNFNLNNDISVEMLYRKDDVLDFYVNDRRLFYSDEFEKSNIKMYKHKNNKNIFCLDVNRLTRNRIEIVADKVMNFSSETSIALSKEDFANEILTKQTVFDNIEYLSGFRHIFDKIQKIIGTNI